LVYDSEAILPVDVMWESPAVEQYDEGISKDNRRVDIDKGPDGGVGESWEWVGVAGGEGKRRRE
jgi:hypothetical protein